MPQVYPVVDYLDAPAMSEFLQRAFGFEVLQVVENRDGTYAHAELICDGGIVMINSRKTSDDKPSQFQMTGIYITVANPDAHFERAHDAGAEILAEPFDTDYGSRDYIARDPEGLTWYFGTYGPKLPAG